MSVWAKPLQNICPKICPKNAQKSNVSFKMLPSKNRLLLLLLYSEWAEAEAEGVCCWQFGVRDVVLLLLSCVEWRGWASWIERSWLFERRSSCYACLCQYEPRDPTVSLSLYANDVPRSHHVRNVECSMEVLIASDVCVCVCWRSMYCSHKPVKYKIRTIS